MDTDIRAHNRQPIGAHLVFWRTFLRKGSSIAFEIIEEVRARAAGKSHVLVHVDTHCDACLCSPRWQSFRCRRQWGSYCIVFESVTKNVPGNLFPGRPREPGNNPQTALWDFLKVHPELQVDGSIQHSQLITVAPDAQLKRLW